MCGSSGVLNLVLVNSVVAGGGGGMRPEAQALGVHQYTFCSHLKTHLKQKFRAKYAYYGKKHKNCFSVRPPLASSARPLCCYSCLLLQLCQVFFSTKCVLLPTKKKKITTVNVLLLLLLHLFLTSNSVVFVDGDTRIFLAPGCRVP